MSMAFLLGLCVIAHAQAPAAAANAPVIHRVVVIADLSGSAPARHGVAKMEQALRAHGVEVSESAEDFAHADAAVLAGIYGGSGPALSALGNVPPPSGPETLVVHTGATYRGKPAIILCGGDGVGLMYAALDLAQRVSWTRPGADPFAFAHNANEKPQLRDRSVVMFTMNRAYFESRLHNPQYLERYLDMLAEDRINMLTLTFGYERRLHGAALSLLL